MQAYSYYFSRDNVGLPGVALYFKVLTQVELAEVWGGIEVGCPLASHCSRLNAVCVPVCLQLLQLLLRHQACQGAQHLPPCALLKSLLSKISAALVLSLTLLVLLHF